MNEHEMQLIKLAYKLTCYRHYVFLVKWLNYSTYVIAQMTICPQPKYAKNKKDLFYVNLKFKWQVNNGRDVMW